MLLTVLTQTPPFKGVPPIPDLCERRPWRPWRNLTAPTSECLSCRAASGGLARALTKHPFLG
jgi:hypothetical protein